MRGTWDMRELAIAALQWAVILTIGIFLLHRLFVDWFSWLTGVGFGAALAFIVGGIWIGLSWMRR